MREDTGTVGTVAGASLQFFKLPVRDLAAQEAFYTAALGFELRDRMATPDFDETLLGIPGEPQMLILIRYRDADSRPASGGTIGFATPDIDSAHARLAAAGATPKGAILDLSFVRVCLLDDPEGNEIELIQQGKPA